MDYTYAISVQPDYSYIPSGAVEAALTATENFYLNLYCHGGVLCHEDTKNTIITRLVADHRIAIGYGNTILQAIADCLAHCCFRVNPEVGHIDDSDAIYQYRISVAFEVFDTKIVGKRFDLCKIRAMTDTAMDAVVTALELLKADIIRVDKIIE